MAVQVFRPIRMPKSHRSVDLRRKFFTWLAHIKKLGERYESSFFQNILLALGRKIKGGRVVIALAFSSNNLTSNPDYVLIFSMKYCLKEQKVT